MISAGRIREIIAQYEKHGWILRRVLLSDSLRVRVYDELVALTAAESGVEFVSSDIDAAWFSRASQTGEAWELRRLAETPFALFESFDEDDDEENRDAARQEMENKLRSAVIK